VIGFSEKKLTLFIGKMAKRLTSKENLIIKRVKQLEAKKYRDRFGQFVIEGPVWVRESLSESIETDFVIFSDSYEQYGGREAEELIEAIEEKGTDLYCIEDGLYGYISGTQTPQGIMAVVQRPVWSEDILRKDKANVLVLDRVSDPGNLGTMLRTAEAAGFEAVIALKGTTDPYSGKVSRASAGSLMRMPIFFVEDGTALKELMADCGKRTLCTDPLSDNDYFDIEIAENTALIIGNEAGGVCPEIFEKADLTCGIPMVGRTESLNAAVAAAIIMYESVRQRRK